MQSVVAILPTACMRLFAQSLVCSIDFMVVRMDISVSVLNSLASSQVSIPACSYNLLY